MSPLKPTLSALGTTLVFVVLLLALAPSNAGAASYECTSSAMYTVAHEDDSLLFQSPALLQDIKSSRCVTTVFLTAGDAGRPQSYWGTREEGTEAAYAQMADAANEWTESHITANGHSILLETLDEQPGITLVFMRLPDGGTDGKGFPLYDSQSIVQLWRGGQGEEPAISSIEAVDGSNTYTYEGLTETLAALMDSSEPRQIATQNFDSGIFEGDHPDHVVTGYFTRAAEKLYGGPDRLVGYQGYPVSTLAQNVFGEPLGAKSFAFYAYGAHDSDACSSEPGCAPTEYSKWLKRQYVTGTETLGVVANAGYVETVTPSSGVTLDGSQSSAQSGNALTYDWTQIRGPAVTLSGATTATPTFTTPSHPTLLRFSLTVSDGSASSEADTVDVRVPSEDPTPTAVAGAGQTVSSEATVHLDGSESFDPNSEPLQYAWLQTGGPLVAITGSSTVMPTFVAPTGPTTVTLALMVSNGEETSAPSTVTITVKGIAPAITSAASTSFTTSGSHSFAIATTGSPKPALTRTGTLPAGVTFADNGDGTATLAGTPSPSSTSPGTSREYPLTFKAANSVGEASQPFVLTVVNNSPVITSATSTSFTTGVTGSFTVATTGVPSPALTRAGTLPAGLTFSDQGNGTAKITGTPESSAAPPASSQEYPLTFKAENDSGSASQVFTLTVLNPGTPPAFTSAASTSFTTGTSGSFTISTTGAPSAAISQSGALPAGLTFSDQGNGTAKITGTPDASAAPAGSSQQYPLTFKAQNAVKSVNQTFTLTVVNPGMPPDFTSAASTSFTTSGSHSFAIATTGSPKPALTRTGTLPAGVTFADNGDGTATLAGTPSPSSTSPGTSREYPLTFKAANSVDEASQPFVLTVVNNSPAFTSAASTSFTTGVAGSFTVATTGVPAPALTRAGTLPAGLTFSDQGNGTAKITGTPDASAAPPASSQEYPLTFKAENDSGSASQTFTLTVVNPGTPPAFISAASTSFTTGVTGSFTISTTGAPSASISQSGALPAGLTFSDQGNGTAKITGTPDASAAPAGSSQQYPLTFKAQNAVKSVNQTFTLTVLNRAPVITSVKMAAFTTGSAGSFTVTTTGPSTAALSHTGRLPTGLTFTDNGDGTGTLAGMPSGSNASPGTSAEFPVAFVAQDGFGTTTQAFTVTVVNNEVAPAITSGRSASFETGRLASFEVTSTGTPLARLSLSGGLPSGISFADNGDGTATISGVATAARAPVGSSHVYGLEIGAENGAGSATQSFALTVVNTEAPPPIRILPSFIGPDIQYALASRALNITFEAAGGPTISLAGDLPTGLRFAAIGPGRATLSGVPTTATTATVTVVATNASGSVSKTLTLVVEPRAKLAKSKLRLPLGRRSRRLVRIDAPPGAAVRCNGRLPKGARCLVKGRRAVLVEVSAKVRGARTYHLVVRVASRAGTVTRPLAVRLDKARRRPVKKGRRAQPRERSTNRV